MKNRDMFYQNLNQGYMAPPSGYNINTQYQAYGQNVIPYNIQNNPNNIINNDYEERISKLERQVKNLDTRLQKIESINIKEDNFYMI